MTKMMRAMQAVMGSRWWPHRPGEPLRCAQVMNVLQRYLDSAMEEVPADPAAVAAHLEHCRRCGLEASVYQEIKDSLARHNAPLDAATLRRLRRFGEGLAQSEGSADAPAGP